MKRVKIEKLVLVNFRNIKKTSILPNSRFNIISGRNGMGKTNLIEAIYLIGSLRSFRTSSSSDIIFSKEEASKIKGAFGESSAGLSCEIIIEKNGRKVLYDGKKATLDGSHFRNLPMVLFHPGNMNLVQGGPEFRRRFLDRALFQADPLYPSTFRSYSKVLLNRNRLLKNKPVDKRSLLPFDVQLASQASKIVKMRELFIENLKSNFEEAVKEISDGNLSSLVYQPKHLGNENDFLKVYESSFQKDSDRGYTTIGPHADDIIFKIDGLNARKFASQGQQRTLVLAAKIAETKALEKSCGKIPLLLLDDVSSELDRDRNKHLFEFLSKMGGQVFITTTHQDHIPITKERKDFFVDNGKIISL